jgi:hypothetical protein
VAGACRNVLISAGNRESGERSNVSIRNGPRRCNRCVIERNTKNINCFYDHWSLQGEIEKVDVFSRESEDLPASFCRTFHELMKSLTIFYYFQAEPALFVRRHCGRLRHASLPLPFFQMEKKL